MYSIIPFILIIVSLSIMIAIIVRRYPQLTLLDVDSIPEVKIEKKKNELLKNRLTEEAKVSDEKWRKTFVPVLVFLKKLQSLFRAYFFKVHQRVKSLKNSEKPPAKIKIEENGVKIDLTALLQSGTTALQQKNYDVAEGKFIEIIKIDPKNTEAYYGLGQVYLQKESLSEAKEAFEFILKLNPNNDLAIIKLAEMARNEGDVEKAIEYYEKSILLDDTKAARFVAIAELAEKINRYELALEAVQQAVDLEPQNPKYLDMLVEYSVKCGNKELATQAYKELRMVNPDNGKLVVLKDKIDQL